MKKLFLLIVPFLLFGCSNSLNTPTGAVENFLNAYQNLDSNLLEKLDKVIEKDEDMNDEQKQKYHDLMVKQYKNLSYKIKSEDTMGEEAEVEVEIEVLNYASSIREAKKYYKEHPDEVDNFMDYKIQNMSNVTNKTHYTITFYLVKIDQEWVVEELDDVNIQKIHGLYE